MIPVYLASDHRGFALKQKLLGLLPAALVDYNFQDLGPQRLDPTDDYNDAAIAVARAITSAAQVSAAVPSALRINPNAFGILLCGSGIGISIQANRFKGIRAALISNLEDARLARAHNSANVLCLSATLADKLDDAQILELISAFLLTPFSQEARHLRRIQRLDEEVQL